MALEGAHWDSIHNVGNRQSGREHGKNTSFINPEAGSFVSEINKKINVSYSPDFIYGDGFTAEKILKKLKEYKPEIQKKITY